MKRISILISLIVIIQNILMAQPRYVTTIHPFKEILQSVVGERGEVVALLPPGASPHTYELRPSDIRKVEQAEALFYGANNLDAWATKFGSRKKIELIQLIPEEFLIHFTGQDEAAEHEGSSASLHHHDEGDIDPHFWTDPLTINAMLPALVTKLCELDPPGAAIYKKNAALFSERLILLSQQISEKMAPYQGTAIMLAHPFFQYYMKRYGLTPVALIEKNPGKEPTPRDVKNFIQIVNTEKVRLIFTHPQLPDRAAKLVAEATGVKIVELDPLGGVAGRQNYDELLLYNTQKIVEALE